MSHEHENLIISLMEARKKGKTIQFTTIGADLDWSDMADDDFEFPKRCLYRIKQEPREFLLAKWKNKEDIKDNYWIVIGGCKYTKDEDVDYIRVREILED